ncbi:alpha/beta-hydrolase [Mycena capillaripes]|nr:alpha/beta-hydrolase [Mycena capillaripes]
MDQSKYKQTKTQRGLTYSYYLSLPAAEKPMLFFSHGFPSASFLWRKQVAFFQPLGYGLIVPDHLGYGGTDKPTDPKLYIGSGLAQDMADILDAEKIEQVIVIGHDRGSMAASRLINHHGHRVSACAFFGVGYLSPSESTDIISKATQLKEMVGYDVFAYQRFLIHPDAPALIEKNIDSFISLVYPETPELWKNTLCVDGGAREWIESNKTTPSPSYATEEDKDRIRTSLLSGGLSAPLCWYKGSLEKTNLEDDAKVSPVACEVASPLIFVAFTNDHVSRPIFGDSSHKKYARGKVTRKEIAADHWGVMSHADELNEILLQWIETLEL